MKGTELFKAAIQNYLEYRAMTDDLFAPRYANPAKNIDDCMHIPADTRSAFPVISVHSPVSIQCRWQS